MKNILIVLCIVISTQTNAQTLKHTYYDYMKTKVDEEYFVNSKGEKNGKYKEYTSEGPLGQEANYKNGQLDGLYIKYTTYTGTANISSKETYKDGVLTGPATYYGQGGIILKQGNYLNEKKEGKWVALVPYINYDLTDDKKKGADYIKIELIYSNDNVVDGKYKTFYYPNNVQQGEMEYKNGVKAGNEKSYYPNGKIQSETKVSEDGKLIALQKQWYYNGQLKLNDDWQNNTHVYEEYNSDGTPTSNMKYVAEQDKLAKEKNIQYREYIHNADSVYNLKKYNDARNLYQSALNYAKGSRENDYPNQRIREIEDMDRAAAEKERAAKAKEAARLNETKNILNQKLNQYQKLYVKVEYVRSSTGQTINDINTGQPVTTESYLIGEHLYKKSYLVIQEYVAAYNSAKTLDEINNTFKKQETALDKLIELASHDSKELKELNKKLKKVDKADDIKAILGI